MLTYGCFPPTYVVLMTPSLETPGPFVIDLERRVVGDRPPLVRVSPPLPLSPFHAGVVQRRRFVLKSEEEASSHSTFSLCVNSSHDRLFTLPSRQISAAQKPWRVALASDWFL